MIESTSALEQVGYPALFIALVVVLVASGFFYSASKKFVRYFKKRQLQDAAEAEAEAEAESKTSQRT